MRPVEQRASLRVPGADAIMDMSSVDPVVTRRSRALFWVKVVHTVVWAVFAGCIVAVPFVLWLGRLSTALVLVALVTVEVVVLVANGMTCPLTDVAARFTDDRRDNFDIFLPLWLARHNKLIFGSWFALDLVLVLAWWLWGNTFSGPS